MIINLIQTSRGVVMFYIESHVFFHFIPDPLRANCMCDVGVV